MLLTSVNGESYQKGYTTVSIVKELELMDNRLVKAMQSKFAFFVYVFYVVNMFTIFSLVFEKHVLYDSVDNYI